MNLDRCVGVLHINVIISYDFISNVSGIYTFTRSLTKSLIDNNLMVSLIYRERGPKVKVYLNPDLPDLFSEYKSRENFCEYKVSSLIYITIKLLFCFLAILKVMSINKRHKISLIHAQDINYGAFASIILSLMLHIPVIMHGHNMDPRHPNALVRGVELFINRLAFNHSTRIICVSKAVKQYVINLGADPKKVTELLSGIIVEKFKARENSRSIARHLLRIDKESFVIGYVGRLSPEKNIRVLIEAVADLINSKRLKKTFLIIIGEGPEKTKLRELAEELGIKRHVLFTGFFKKDISDIIHGIDVFVLPSLTEGLCLSLLEAKAAGRAIIASNIPPIREIISNGKTGLLVNPRKKGEITNAILELYKNPELRRIMSANAADEAAHHDQREFFKKLLEIYKLACY